MNGILDGFRLIEGSAFVAAPLRRDDARAARADVIRFDQIGGWARSAPLAARRRRAELVLGRDERGKRSIHVDIRAQDGRELVRALIAAPVRLLTSFPARG